MAIWKIYWWAKTDKPRKSGTDIIVADEDLNEDKAERLLDYLAEGNMPDSRHPAMKNFIEYYPMADFCEDFGLVKIRRRKDITNKEDSN